MDIPININGIVLQKKKLNQCEYVYNFVFENDNNIENDNNLRYLRITYDLNK